MKQWRPYFNHHGLGGIHTKIIRRSDHVKFFFDYHKHHYGRP